METVVTRMASDLGIDQFTGEPLPQYRRRVVYSAMASWLKTIALDQPLANQEETGLGISLRHLYERSRAVFETICKNDSPLGAWFEPEEKPSAKSKTVRPMIRLVSRLINHGDIVNVGFKTNVALSKIHTSRLTSEIESVFGEIMGNDLHYAGVAVIRNRPGEFKGETPESAQDWLNAFIHDAWWQTASDRNSWEYFCPASYRPWQDSEPSASDGVTLARRRGKERFKKSYEYYLFKPDVNLFHQIDPFLQKRGCHIRLILALRAQANKQEIASAEKYDDHVNLRLSARLPVTENTLLESYAWPIENIDDRYSWSMNIAIWNYIKPYIEALGIQVREKDYGPVRG